MDSPRILARLVFLLPLAALAALAQPIEGGPGPYLVLAVFLAWARLGAGLGRRHGRALAIMIFESLPLALFTALRFTDLGLAPALILGLSFFAYPGFLLLGEEILAGRMEGALPVLGFILAGSLPALLDLGLALELTTWLSLGLASLGSIFVGYALLRRSR